jgi:hypothetical protein
MQTAMPATVLIVCATGAADRKRHTLQIAVARGALAR